MRLLWGCPGGDAAPWGPRRRRPPLCSPPQAVYRCPDQVWHVELLPQPRQLYILCAHSGIYCVALEQQSR